MSHTLVGSWGVEKAIPAGINPLHALTLKSQSLLSYACDCVLVTIITLLDTQDNFSDPPNSQSSSTELKPTVCINLHCHCRVVSSRCCYPSPLCDLILSSVYSAYPCVGLLSVATEICLTPFSDFDCNFLIIFTVLKDSYPGNFKPVCFVLGFTLCFLTT